MKRLLILSVIALAIASCAKKSATDNTLTAAPEETRIEQPVISLPAEHLTFFDISLATDSASFVTKVKQAFSDSIRGDIQVRKFDGRQPVNESIIVLFGLPYRTHFTTHEGQIASVRLSSPNVYTDDEDPEGIQSIRDLYARLVAFYGEPSWKKVYSLRGSDHADWYLENGIVRFTWTGCCASSYCNLEFIDRENTLLSLLRTNDPAAIREDSCALGHLYRCDSLAVLDVTGGLYPITQEDDLLFVPQYRGYAFLQKKFGHGQFYKARARQSVYPNIVIPKNVDEYYSAGDWHIHTTDSSTVYVRSWQLPDSAGFVYYIAHQDDYIDGLPTWTTLIYSPTSLSSKFVHRRYHPEHVWINDARY